MANKTTDLPNPDRVGHPIFDGTLTKALHTQELLTAPIVKNTLAMLSTVPGCAGRYNIVCSVEACGTITSSTCMTRNPRLILLFVVLEELERANTEPGVAFAVHEC